LLCHKLNGASALRLGQFGFELDIFCVQSSKWYGSLLFLRKFMTVNALYSTTIVQRSPQQWMSTLALLLSGELAPT
jgi:hypothetical protein